MFNIYGLFLIKYKNPIARIIRSSLDIIFAKDWPIEYRAVHKRSSVLDSPRCGSIGVQSGRSVSRVSGCFLVQSSSGLRIYTLGCVPISLECPHVARAYAALLNARRLSVADWSWRDVLEDRHRGLWHLSIDRRTINCRNRIESYDRRKFCLRPLFYREKFLHVSHSRNNNNHYVASN